MLKHVGVKRFSELAADRTTLLPTDLGIKLLDTRQTDVDQHVRYAIGKPGDPEATLGYIVQTDQCPWTHALAYFAQQGDVGSLQPVG